MAILLEKSSDLQADLFSLLEPPTKPELKREVVPERLAIAANRFYLVIRQGDRHWSYPVQFTELETSLLMPRLEEFNWSLTDSGIPIELDRIHAVVESFIGGEVKS